MRWTALLVALLCAAPAAAHDDGPPPPGPPRAPPLPRPPAPASAPAAAGGASPSAATLQEIRGLLEVLRLDGWLLTDLRGDNPTALDLVRPARLAERRWFYLIAARGEPLLLAHVGDAGAFEHVAGRKVAYQGFRDLAPSLKTALKGKRKVAMEVAHSIAQPATRLDATAAEAVLRAGALIVTSGDLRLARARWDQRAREQHLLAAHHLARVRDEALETLRRRLGEGGAPPTEVELEKQMLRALKARGLETEAPPTVAAGAHSAIPGYLATAAQTGVVQLGDVVLVRLTGRMRAPGAPYASLTHVVFVGARVPDAVAKAYAAARAASDAAVALLRERFGKGTAVRGWEVDAAARKALVAAGLGDRVMHPTGHALEPRFPGSALALDDYDGREERVVPRGLGLRVAPGVYFAGEFGLRAERNLFLGPKGPEELSPAQAAVQPLFAPPRSELLELQ
ncbi:MAG TPA: M24 family metallopeptidase [Polyangia bacterium]|jgi:Xaa-Pro aminopeptidase